MNLHLAKQLKEEIHRLLWVGCITPIDNLESFYLFSLCQRKFKKSAFAWIIAVIGHQCVFVTIHGFYSRWCSGSRGVLLLGLFQWVKIGSSENYLYYRMESFCMWENNLTLIS